MIEAAPFLPHLPSDVQEASEWFAAKFTTHQIDASLALLRAGSPVAGWLAGIAMFGDTRRVIAGVMERERLFAAIPQILDAFAIGLGAGIAPTKRQWMVIERLVARNPGPVPERFCELLATAACAESPITRDHVGRIVALVGEPARLQLIAARATAADSRHERRLDDALAAALPPLVDVSREHDLLVRLLAAWRETRALELEAPIRRLGRLLATRRGPLESKTGRDEVWTRLARDRDPGDLDVLLDARCRWSYALRARIEELGKLPPDPRMVRVLEKVAMFDSASYAPAYADLVEGIVAHLLPHLTSPSIAPVLDAMARTRPEHAQLLAPIFGAIRVPGAADPSLVEEASIATHAHEEIDRLAALVLADPDDLAPRAVLADALEATADPRGELITLQLAIDAGTDDAKLHARAATLLATGFETWTAEMPTLERESSRFEYGFVTSAATGAEARSLAFALERPCWATVATLDLEAGDLELEPIVRALPRLRSLTCTNPPPLARLAEAGVFPQLRALGAIHAGWVPETLHAFPNLRVVAGHWWGADALVEFRDAMRRAASLGLEAIAWLDLRHDDLGAAMATFDGTIKLRFSFPIPRSRGFTPIGWVLECERDVMRYAWTGDATGTESARAVRRLPHYLFDKRLEVYVPPSVPRREEILDEICAGTHDIVRGGPFALDR